MKIFKLSILISCLLSVLTCSAKKYQIKVLNTPTITIDNKEAKVGDWFDDQSVIVWSKDNQAMRVVSEDNKVYTLSGKLYKEAKAKKFSDFILYTKPLAARGTNDLDLIEQLADRFDNHFIMLDEIVIDLTDMEVKTSYVIVLERTGDNNNKCTSIYLHPNGKSLTIQRSDIFETDCNKETEILVRVSLAQDSGVTAIISENFEIDVLPTSLY